MAQKRKKSVRRAVARKKVAGAAATYMGFGRLAAKLIVKRKRVQVKGEELERTSVKTELDRKLTEHEEEKRGTISGAEMKRTISLLQRRSDERLRFLDKK